MVAPRPVLILNPTERIDHTNRDKNRSRHRFHRSRRRVARRVVDVSEIQDGDQAGIGRQGIAPAVPRESLTGTEPAMAKRGEDQTILR